MAEAQDTSPQPRLTHSGLINQVTSLQCPICYKFMTEPKVLSCGHTFCLTCLSKIVRENKLRCALCRTVTLVIDSDAATLPNNLAFRSVVEEVANLEGRCDVCDNMGKPDKITYCQDCNLYMCPDCLVNHREKTENYNHSVRKSRRSKDLSSLKMENIFCTRHLQNKGTGICVKCSVYVCKKCSVTHTNEGHEVLNLVQYATSLHFKATPLQNDIKSIQKLSTSCVQQCKYYENRTIQHIDSVMSQINDEYRWSLKKLEEKRLSKLKACSDLKENMSKISEDLIDQIERCISLLNQASISIQGVLNSPFEDMPAHSSTLESYQSKIKDLKWDINYITEKPQTMFKDGNMLNFQKKWGCEYYDIVELKYHFWERTSYLLTQHEKAMSCMAVNCEGNVVVGYFHGGIEVFTGTGSRRASVVSLKEVCVMAMSFGNDGNLVVRNINNQISVYGRTLEKYDTKFETIVHKEGGDGEVALDMNNDIYASYRRINVIQINRKQGGKAKQEIKCDGFVPQQILVMSNFDIIVMDAATIRVLDESGASKSEIMRKGSLGYPAVAWDGTLIIAWVKPEGRSVELVKYTQDMKNNKTLHLDNDIDLSGRQWFYCRVIDADNIVFCCPKQVHIFSLNIRPYSSQAHEDGRDEKRIIISRALNNNFAFRMYQRR